MQLISYISTYSIKIVSTKTEENKPVIRLHNWNHSHILQIVDIIQVVANVWIIPIV